MPKFFKVLIIGIALLSFIQCQPEEIIIKCAPPLEEDKFYFYGNYDSLSITRYEPHQRKDDCPFVSILMCGFTPPPAPYGTANISLNENGTFEFRLIFDVPYYSSPFESDTTEFYFKGTWRFSQTYDYNKTTSQTHIELKPYISGSMRFDIFESSIESTTDVYPYGRYDVHCSGGSLMIIFPEKYVNHKIDISFPNF